MPITFPPVPLCSGCSPVLQPRLRKYVLRPAFRLLVGNIMLTRKGYPRFFKLLMLRLMLWSVHVVPMRVKAVVPPALREWGRARLEKDLRSQRVKRGKENSERRRAQVAEPPRSKQPRPKAFEIALSAAREASKSQSWRKAAQRWAAVIDGHPKKVPPSAFVQLSIAYAHLGSFDAAEAALLRGKACHPDCPDVASKPLHIIICGASRSGTTMLYNMVRSSVSNDVWCPPNEIAARKTLCVTHRTMITKRPLDLFEVKDLAATLGRIRSLRVVVMIRDPRALVSSIHQSVPNQYFQGFDYQFFVSRAGVKSYTSPGVMDVFREIQAIGDDAGIDYKIVRYEDLVKDPRAVQQSLFPWLGLEAKANFADFHRQAIPDSLQRALNGVRPVDEARALRWLKPEALVRVKHQLALCPELEDIVREFGYPPTRTLAGEIQYHDYRRGVLIAFHTPDPVYSGEAARFRKSVEKLCLQHEITEVPSRGSWVENCSRKPAWILGRRMAISGPLLYVDVDAVLHSDPWPYLSGYDGDVAVFVRENGNVASGTIWVNDTDGARELLTVWKQACDADPTEWDQRVLQAIIERDERAVAPRFNVQRLPVNMTFIFDKGHRHVYGGVVIEHLQASRVDRAGTEVTPSLERREARLRELGG